MRRAGPPWAFPFAGALDERVIDSETLTGNPLGDPHRRPLLVQLPPGYDAETDRRYPTVYVLQGLTGQVDQWLGRRPAAVPNTPEGVDALFASGEAPPAIVVYVDAWTSLGGSQFIDSPGTGRYHTYLCEEVVPFVDAEYRTLPDAAHRALAGHSSGGYGAMVNAMLRPDLFGAFATHAGDALFEACYAREFGQAARALRDRYEGSFQRFWDEYRTRRDRAQPSDGVLVNLWCMAACYSTDPDGTVHLPFEPETGRLVPEVWERWLAWDPVRMVPARADALRAMRAIWIDAGRSDEYFLDLAADAFRRELAAIGVTEPLVRFELHEGGHGGSAWRYPLAIAWLAERLTPRA
ncbi:MAG TPA: alpha/beta hydrolase-fold protein [candidate division Zixibacteria bacterium]|nr:alpha/beta hydrolase-fold protein [candidate division Zixibacteria bacterium]